MSIKKIAEITGVSPATVSRVLNNPGYRCASPETRDIIWETARSLNYVPNEAARNLKKGIRPQDKTCYVAVLVVRMNMDKVDPFFSEMLQIMETELHQRYCILTNVWYEPLFSNDRKCRAADLRRMIDHMFQETEGRCQGLIVLGRCNRQALHLLKATFKNIVNVNRNSTFDEVDEVTADGKKVAAAAVEYLISLGHKDIGYVGEIHNEERYQGYIETMDKRDLTPDPAYVVECKQSEAEGYAVMERLLAAGDLPTAIYCANDIIAIGMLQCLQRKRNRYYSVSVISSDNIEQSQFTNPMLSTVDLSKGEMGGYAIHLLLDRIHGGHISPVKMELGVSIVKRGSCLSLEEQTWNDYCI